MTEAPVVVTRERMGTSTRVLAGVQMGVQAGAGAAAGGVQVRVRNGRELSAMKCGAGAKKQRRREVAKGRCGGSSAGAGALTTALGTQGMFQTAGAGH